jgi:hypothetical protein
MFLRRFTDFVLQNRVQGMATAFVIAFIPVIGSISILIAALTTLRKGAKEGALILVAATLPYIIGYYTSSSPSEQAALAVGMLAIVIVSNILTCFFAVILRQFSNWNFTLELAAALGVVAIGAVHVLYPDIQSWWASQLSYYFAKTAETVGKIPAIDPQAAASDAQIRAQAIAVAKHFATGFVAVSVLFNALLQLLIARWWQAVMFNPGGLRKELYHIRLGHVAGLVFVVGFILAYLGVDFAMDAMPVVYAVFFAAGLSLVHSLISLTKVGWLWLVLIYMGIIWLFPVSLVIIAFIALLDTGFDFRKRFLL